MVLNTALTDLYVEDGPNGCVRGVYVRDTGASEADQASAEPRLIRARRGVILASGGFDHNEQMRVKYQRAPITTEWTVGAKANTGDGIVAAMWQKWAFIASAGALNCLLRGSVGEIAAVEGGDETARAIIDETGAVAAAAGYPLPDAAVEYVLGMLTAPGSPFTASLYRDLQQGRPVEVETILGDFIAEGRKSGQPTPLLDAATVALRIHNAAVRHA